MSQRATELPAQAELLAGLADTRERTLAFAAAIDEADLNRQFDPLMSPLAWDLAHIAAYEDLWLVQQHAGEPALMPDLSGVYDALETPRAMRGDVESLDADGAIAYLAAVRERTLDAAAREGVDEELFDMVLRHEQQHMETMCQAVLLAGLEGFAPAYRREPGPATGQRSGLEFVEVAGGAFLQGHDGPGFAFDNERPAMEVEVDGFEIGAVPVTTGDWLGFVEEGGYEDRALWCEEGWQWRSDEDARAPLYWNREAGTERTACGERPLEPARPVAHVSWFEARAFARSREARLPTEAEWELAATWSGGSAPGPEDGWTGQDGFDTAPVGLFPSGASDCGALDLIGNVWEWTATEFDGYPGFTPHPYPEYSEVFFGEGYRVLRGGSWATAARVATPTFRNWDLPRRRQIFSGLRLARDAA
ncbi:MAG: ergothioneine biosynthesis protein EgtB [Solirubrobacterales bacterium]